MATGEEICPKYVRTYQQKWEEFPDLKDWLRPVKGDDNKAFCLYCGCKLVPKLCDLRKHSFSSKHIRSSMIYSNLKQSQGTGAEGRLTLFIVQHATLNVAYHLTELCRNIFYDSEIAQNMNFDRTRCRQIVEYVMAPHFQRELGDDVGDANFSILIDGSTHVSLVKFVGVTIRYFNKKQCRIVSSFLGFVEVETESAVSFVAAIKKLLMDTKLQSQKLVGIGMDSAINISGLIDSICRLLKEEFKLPNLIVFRCTSFSLQWGLSQSAAKTLPLELPYLVQETYRWLEDNPAGHLYEELNDGEKRLQNPREGDVSWIAIEPAVSRILEHWEKLKQLLETNMASYPCSYMTEKLLELYTEPANRLYLIFVCSILRDIMRITTLVHGGNPNPLRFLQDLSNLILSLSRRVIVPAANINPLTTDFSSFINPKAYLGIEFEQMCQKSNLSKEMERRVRECCLSFVADLCNEFRRRLPENFEVLQMMSLLSVQECFKGSREFVADVAKMLGYSPMQIEKIECQWKKLQEVRWHERTSTLKFWKEVGDYSIVPLANPFKDVYDFVIDIISLPHSDVEVEKLFGQFDIVKLKLRDHSNLNFLSGVLAIKSGLCRQGKCCLSYELPTSALQEIEGKTSCALTGPSEKETCERIQWFSCEDEDDVETIMSLLIDQSRNDCSPEMTLDLDSSIENNPSPKEMQEEGSPCHYKMSPLKTDADYISSNEDYTEMVISGKITGEDSPVEIEWTDSGDEKKEDKKVMMPKRKRGRPRKSEQQQTQSENGAPPSDEQEFHAEVTGEDSPSEIEWTDSGDGKKEELKVMMPKRKRGRPRKYEQIQMPSESRPHPSDEPKNCGEVYVDRAEEPEGYLKETCSSRDSEISPRVSNEIKEIKQEGNELFASQEWDVFDLGRVKREDQPENIIALVEVKCEVEDEEMAHIKEEK
ncbi:uncharacterized protein LOC143035172 isoform X2 [Oratosquilla oratoria]|uniref:uncharacterized protein LOC143035172 isoform X2 n=1 Tax=Oratosquilla oratoria TaxID=337810 RepID=UPI003F758346